MSFLLQLIFWGRGGPIPKATHALLYCHKPIHGPTAQAAKPPGTTQADTLPCSGLCLGGCVSIQLVNKLARLLGFAIKNKMRPIASFYKRLPSIWSVSHMKG